MPTILAGPNIVDKEPTVRANQPSKPCYERAEAQDQLWQMAQAVRACIVEVDIDT
jgi:hypothetical protein